MTWLVRGWPLTLGRVPTRPHNKTSVYEPCDQLSLGSLTNSQPPRTLHEFINRFVVQPLKKPNLFKTEKQEEIALNCAAVCPWRGQTDKHFKTWKQGSTITSAHPPTFLLCLRGPSFPATPLPPCPLQASFRHDGKGETVHSTSATLCCLRGASRHQTLTEHTLG